jgi:hypothetical protein
MTPALIEILDRAWAAAAPGREAAEQNAVLRSLWEGLRHKHRRPAHALASAGLRARIDER